MTRVYKLSEVPSVAEYLRGLQAIAPRMSEIQRSLLVTQYRAPEHSLTATQLAGLVGARRHSVVNLQYGRLGKMFCEETGFEPDKREVGTYRWWAVWSLGYSTRSGFLWVMLPEVAEALERLGWVTPEEFSLPEEVPVGGKLAEGAVRRVKINAYERNPAARARCIEHHGASCTVCSFDFESAYGPLAAGFVHVHHLKPLSEIGERYEIDPIKDLRPVCPNCHAVIHLDGRTRTIEEVQSLLKQAAIPQGES
jgi:5-methylcytosine-specific restriction enzyme A